MRLLLASALGLALIAPASAQAAGGPALTCAGPIGANDSAAKLKARLGAQARVEMVPGAEGEELKALVLWPKDKARRVEVIYFDDAMIHPSTARLAAEKPVWSIGGLRMGDPMAKAEALNGKPFELQGFDWDYGGYVTDFKKGRLDRLPGGCSIGVRFEPSASNVPNGISGDMILSSSMAKVRAARPVISELSLEWPAPKGM